MSFSFLWAQNSLNLISLGVRKLSNMPFWKLIHGKMIFFSEKIWGGFLSYNTPEPPHTPPLLNYCKKILCNYIIITNFFIKRLYLSVLERISLVLHVLYFNPKAESRVEFVFQYSDAFFCRITVLKSFIKDFPSLARAAFLAESKRLCSVWAKPSVLRSFVC